jgi:hypothetical protein
MRQPSPSPRVITELPAQQDSETTERDEAQGRPRLIRPVHHDEPEVRQRGG